MAALKSGQVSFGCFQNTLNGLDVFVQLRDFFLACGNLVQQIGDLLVSVGDIRFQAGNAQGAMPQLFHILLAGLDHRFGLTLDPALLDGKLRPHVIPFGGQFRHRHRKRSFDALARLPLRPAMQNRNQQQQYQRRSKEAQRKEHDGVGHSSRSLQDDARCIEIPGPLNRITRRPLRPPRYFLLFTAFCAT